MIFVSICSFFRSNLNAYLFESIRAARPSERTLDFTCCEYRAGRRGFVTQAHFFGIAQSELNSLASIAARIDRVLQQTSAGTPLLFLKCYILTQVVYEQGGFHAHEATKCPVDKKRSRRNSTHTPLDHRQQLLIARRNCRTLSFVISCLAVMPSVQPEELFLMRTFHISRKPGVKKQFIVIPTGIIESVHKFAKIICDPESAFRQDIP